MTNFAPIFAAATKTNPIRIITGSLEVTAAAADGSKGPRAFKVRAYNGGELRVGKYDLPVVIDLAGLSFAKDIKANLDHDVTKRVGHVEKAHNDLRGIDLEGLVSAASESATEFEQSYDRKYKWKASIEALPSKLEEIRAGQRVTVNGKTFTGPIYVARKSRLFGVAFLARGADEESSVTLAAGAADSEQETGAMNWNEWIKALGFDEADLSEQQRKALKEKFDAEIKAQADDERDRPAPKRRKRKPVHAGGGDDDEDDDEPIVAAPAFDVNEIRAAHMEFLGELELVFAQHEDQVTDKKKLKEIKAAGWKAAKDLKVKALEEKWSGTRLEIEAVRAKSKFELELVKAEAPAGPAIHASTRDATPEVIEAALALSAGLEKIEDHYDEKTLDQANKNFKGMGLQEFIILCAADNGYHARPGERMSRANMGRIMAFAMPPVHASGGFPSTMSLPGILSNIANKEMWLGFNQDDPTWREIAAIASVNDFKQVTAYRMLDNMEYEELLPGGRIKHGTVDQESYTRQAKTYAKMFSLTRTDMINDDMSAFDTLKTRVGGGASRKLRKVVWTRFMDNSAFFTSGRGNYITGATTNLGVDGVGLQAALLAFRALADGTGLRIGGRPTRLLVPPELEFNADKLYTSGNVNTGGASTAESVGNANVHANKYKPIVASELSDQNYTGFSSTAYYLLRDKAQGAPIVVSFLHGVQTPTVDANEAEFNTLGIEIRGFHDFGCDLAEYLAGVKSKGAA